jgi:hypothetical protein
MSEEKAKSNFENVYLFLGLDDFESDKKRIKQAFENIEQVYGVKLDKLITKNIKLDVPQHIKDAFSQWGDDEMQGFIADLANKASIYRLVLADPKKLKIYNEQLRAQPELLQGQSHAQKNDKLVGRQFAPDGEENALAAYYKHLEDSVVSGSNFEIKDDAEAEKIQQLLNRFMVTYHKYSWDLKHKPQNVQADFDQGDAEIKDVRVVDADTPIAEAEAAGESQSVDGEYIEAPPRPEPAPEQKRIGHTVDGESSWVDEPEEEFEAEEEEVGFADQPEAPEQKQPKSDVNNEFSAIARGTYFYPQNGREDIADLASPMLIKNTNKALGNANLRVMTSIEGRRYTFNKECGFTMDGRLDVEGLAVSHSDKAPEHVAVFGKVHIQCNGGFFNGNIDGRMRSTKYTPQVQQNAEGQPVQVDVPEHKYSKGKVVIDAGDEDIVINGNIVGNVEIKTTGKVKILGNIDGKVKINAGQSVDIYGSVSSGASVHAGDMVDIRGKKAMWASTSANTSVRGNHVTDSMLHQWRADAVKKHFTALDGGAQAQQGEDNAQAQHSANKQEAPHA